MSGFTALNVEPEDTFEEDIDDTKEIQIEEAFKLYQNALKLHSQGPDFYEAAEEAYQELFQSEVFKYPEAVTDYGHEQLDDVVALPTPANDQAVVPILPTNAADSAANSLPQLIYLSYKNRGQFILDVARHELKNAPSDRKSQCLYYYKYCLKSLRDSASALERDDTDLDLWKKAARISDVIHSQRLVRFCLESVVAGDDEAGEQIIDLSGLDEAYASGELLQVLRLLQDDIGVAKSSATQAQAQLLRMLQKSNNPYAYLPSRPPELEYLQENQRPGHFDARNIVVDLTDPDQAMLTNVLLQSCNMQDNPESRSNLTSFLKISLPTSLRGDSTSAVQAHTDTERPLNYGTTSDLDQHPEQVLSASPHDSAHSPASYHSAQDEVRPEPEADVPDPKLPEVDDESAQTAVLDATQDVSQEQTQSETRLPTRKRSSTAAGNEEPESRTKSKRLRARESLMEVAAHEEEMAQENDFYIREQLAIIEDGDSKCLSHINGLLSSVGLDEFLDSERLQPEVSDGKLPQAASESFSVLVEDMKQGLNNWTEDTSTAIMSGHGLRDINEKSGGMSLFQRHLKATLPKEIELAESHDDDEMTTDFARFVNKENLALVDVAILWLIQLFTSAVEVGGANPSYLRGTWTQEMRDDVIQMVMLVDQILFEQLVEQTRDMNMSPSVDQEHTRSVRTLPMSKAAELVQTIFELQLDEYYRTTNPESQSTESEKREQRDRLRRWAHLAIDCVQILHNLAPTDEGDSLVHRFLFASALFAGLSADSDKGHVLSCLNDVRRLLVQAGDPIFALPNNKVMSQVSTAAIDQEISRLSTLDFFNSIFDNDISDPVAIIMKLEPILEPDEVSRSERSDQDSQLGAKEHNRMIELRSFLDSGDASLKLFLWRRLMNGYATISYTPKVVSCLLHSLEIIVQEISSERHQSLKSQERQVALFKWLRDADDILAKVLSKVSDEPKAFECLDEKHLQTTLTAITKLLNLLHVFVRYDDTVRLGQISPPSLRTSSAMKLFDKARDKMRDFFVRSWTLMFYLMKEATVQLSERFKNPIDQLAEYIRLVHNMLGHRQYCKQCNKLFIKLARTEMLTTRSEIDYSEDVAQILYDMYQIRLGNGFGDANHGCAADPLGRDKDTAFSLVPVIMMYARRLKMRELIKSDLKNTIERIQQTLGQVKTSPALSFNRKAVSAFLKSPINPQEVYRSLKGLGDLLTKPVSGEYAKVASLGWYQMLGSMSLAKYKSVKRVNPTPTDDLDTAGTFLRIDAEHDIGNWETWYRLAQVFDAKIEDSLIWNALKINDSRGEIALLERNAINAYTMAVAAAMRKADDSIDTVQKLSDMFSEFAFRLYASSRPPLSMDAFNTDKHMRHLSSSQDQSMSKTPFIIPFKPYTVWSFAAYLLQRKFATGQKEWLCYYTLGKCFWKMFQSGDNARAKRPVTIEDVLDAFIDAVEHVPAKEKSSDYILEPHYKLVSVVHKLVNRKLLSPAKGSEYLQVTQFARSVHLSEDEQESEWDGYILDILRKLGHADKSNWHHRITARAAHVNYDDDKSIKGALGAKHQFTQQIFTKTMTMQVWKPEYERPGRHYVYTGRYLSFFVHLLDRLNDRASLEQLVRRIRRKTTDFLDHPRIWEETALTYVKLLRRVGKVPDGHERNLFDKISYDDFAKMSEKVEKWAHQPESTPFQDIVQDAIELKRLNNSLMKGPAIDDLIGDAYACMYEAFVAQLPPEEVVAPSATVLPQGTFINMNTDIVPTGDDNLDRMRLNNLLQAQTDGSTPGLTPVTAPAIGLGLNTPPTGTPPLEPVRIPTPSKPGRTKTITRREVQRKAEACIVKPPPIKTPTLAKRPFIDLPSRRDSTASNLQDGTDAEKTNLDDEPPEGSRASSRRPSMSARGSVDPSDADRGAEVDGADDNDGEADDESELSELDNGDDDNNSKAAGRNHKSVKDGYHLKRKAEEGNDMEDDSDGDGEERDEDEEDDGGDDGDDENEGDETGADVGKDDMDVDEPEDNVVEIQDSQEAAESTIMVRAIPQSPMTRKRSHR